MTGYNLRRPMEIRRSDSVRHKVLGRRSFLAGALLLAAGTVTACRSGGGTAPSGASDALRLALSTDLPTLDPGTVYQYGGNQVMTALYEGLLSYSPESTGAIVPMLADKYTVSPDGLTYTFNLRTDVKFDSGRTMTAADVVASFERLAEPKVKSQMSYMVSGVKRYETPDDHTFVVRLNAPSSSFLSLVASPFGPKILDSKILEQNKADNALGYLTKHSAGTGPYVLKSFTKGQVYDLTRRDGYWGGAPFFADVKISVIGDPATQILQLEGGDLDLVTGQPVATLDQLGKQKGYKIVEYPTLQKAQLHIKTSTGPLSSAPLRKALRSAIDRDALVKQIFGDHAAVSTQMYPLMAVPDGLASDGWVTDTSELAALAKGKTITLGYYAGRARDTQTVEALQARWASAGATVELVPVQTNDVYGLSSNLASAPDMMYEEGFPDSVHPDTWARLFWYSNTSHGNGALNYLVGGTPEADAAIDAGARATDQGQIDADYGKAGDLVHEQVGYITLADLKDSFLMRSDLTGGGHWLPCPVTLDLRTLKRVLGGS